MARALLFLLTCWLLAATPAFAALHTVDTPPSPADSKPNSDVVPDAYAISGHFTRIVVIRVKYKADLLAGIKQQVKVQHIDNGVILAGIGSLRGFHIHQVSNRTFPTQNVFINEPDSPADLVGMNGYIVNGKVHAHITLGTSARAMAGHLEPGTQVFTYAIVTIGVLDTALKGVDDKTYR